ncbi:MAG TPA: hypothetical protein VF461_14075 [Gemmatimonadaceae bacterium]
MIVAIADLPSAFADTFDVPTASAVTTPSDEMLTILGSCTVQATTASGILAPDTSCTSAFRGSWALSASVEVAGLTTIVATCGVTSGVVLPHDQLERATATAIAGVRPLLDMSPLLPLATSPRSHRTIDVDRPRGL